MMQTSATLFPDAKIDVFAQDASTREAVTHLEKDWRVARVKLRLDQGDIVSAINRYGNEASPDVIIIETHAIDASFTAHLEHLANVCGPNTSAIFIGPENDITLYRHLLSMGATDYLVRPVRQEDLITVLHKALQHKIGTGNSRLITVMGSKGGVGTTRIAQILAQAMAAHEEKTTLFDCGGGWNMIGNSYGAHALSALRDLATTVRAQEDALDEVCHHIAPNLSWLATGGDPLLVSTLGPDGFETITDALMRRAPNVLIDLSQSATSIRGMAFAKAQHIVLVTTATPICLRNTRLLIKEIHGLRGADAPIHLIVNQRGILAKEEIRSADIAQALGLSPTVEISYAPDVFARLDMFEGQGFLQEAAKLVPLFATLVQKITGKAAPNKNVGNDNPSLVKRLLGRK